MQQTDAKIRHGTHLPKMYKTFEGFKGMTFLILSIIVEKLDLRIHHLSQNIGDFYPKGIFALLLDQRYAEYSD